MSPRSTRLSPRWRKLVADASGERGRVAAMVLGLSVSVVALGAVLGAYAILSREIVASYLGTRPAAATLEIPAGVDPALLATVRADPLVQDAEARGVIVARVRNAEDWRPLLLFVVDDFEKLTLNTFARVSGAWPPPPRTMLVERSAVGMVGAGEGGTLSVKAPHGAEQPLTISGVVHDPGLAPAWQERQGYGYITRDTARLLGESGVLDELRVTFTGERTEVAAIEAAAADVASRLQTGSGAAVHQIRVPPPNLHPHQRQMMVILTMMLMFAGLSLVLSAILVATSLSAMLARQVREIGVMKTLGATRAQLTRLYVVLVTLIGVAASLVALPLGVAGARAFAAAVSGMLNFDVASLAEPWWVFAVQAAAGVGVPLAVALVPIMRATSATVRAALDRHGASAGIARLVLRSRVIAAIPRPARDVLRRPGRLVLTLMLLAAGGAMFMAALDVKQSWRATLEKIPLTRFYDVEARLHAAAPPSLVAALEQLPGVARVETWGYSPAAFARSGAIDVVRTYPDRGHGSFHVLAPPLDTTLVAYPVLAGRWLTPADASERVVVLNHSAHAQAGRVLVGDEVALSLDGSIVRARVVGVVEEIGAAGVAYVSPAVVAAVPDARAEARVVRISFREHARTGAERVQAVRAVEAVLALQHAPVDVVMPLEELRTAIGEHVMILVNALSALALIMAIVGVLGLATTIGVSVLERTREIGVMKTLGATPARVRRMIVAEALTVALVSVVLATLASLPLAFLLDTVIGKLGFLAPLEFVVDPLGVVAWVVLVVVSATLAALVPATRAAALSPRSALAELP